MPLEHFVAVAVLLGICVIESKLGFYITDNSPLYESVVLILNFCRFDTA